MFFNINFTPLPIFIYLFCGGKEKTSAFFDFFLFFNRGNLSIYSSFHHLSIYLYYYFPLPPFPRGAPLVNKRAGGERGGGAEGLSAFVQREGPGPVLADVAVAPPVPLPVPTT